MKDSTKSLLNKSKKSEKIAFLITGGVLSLIIALWAVPRSVSTAFERVFIERGDFKIFHEPFSVSYYYSAERRHLRYSDIQPRVEYNFDFILKQIIETSYQKPVFFKDMAYHFSPWMNKQILSSFHNTFIIRDPVFVLPSLYKLLPDFELEETGYKQQYELFNLVINECKQPPIVIDASDLCENPEAMLEAYCNKLGISHKKNSTTWVPREIPEWKIWEKWHIDAMESSGIRKMKIDKEKKIAPHLKTFYDECLPYYQELYKYRLKPTSTVAFREE